MTAAIPEIETFVGAWTAARTSTRPSRNGRGSTRSERLIPTPSAAGAPRRRRPRPGARRRVDGGVRGRGARIRRRRSGRRGWSSRGWTRPSTPGCGCGRRRATGVDVGYGARPQRHPDRTRLHPAGPARRGYATSLVAAQTGWLLGTGRTFAFLYGPRQPDVERPLPPDRVPDGGGVGRRQVDARSVA